MSVPASISWVIVFILIAVAISAGGRRAGLPTPLLLVAVGAVASFIPGVPAVRVEPDVIMYVLLPPLLFAAARQTHFADLKLRRDTVFVLAVGTVIATVVVVGAATYLVLPTIGLAAAFAFAAVVAPTETSAVTALSSRIRLTRRVRTVLEGESLFNDAAALIALNAGVLALEGTLSLGRIGAEVVFTLADGIIVGFAVGWAQLAIRARNRSAVLDTCLAVITPYLGFLLAELIHGSGALAVVISGLLLGTRSASVQTAEARTAELVIWRTVQFVLENAVFLLIGLSLSGIVAGVSAAGLNAWTIGALALVILVAMIVARFMYVFAVGWVFRHGPSRLRRQNVEWRNVFIVAAVGVRGVVTLAAAFLLPAATPDRALLQLLAFIIVAVTVASCSALPYLIKISHFPDGEEAEERNESRLLLADVKTAALKRLNAEPIEQVDPRMLSHLREDATLMLDLVEKQPEDAAGSSLALYNRLRRRMVRAEWEGTLRAHASARYSAAAIVAILRVIDAEETAVRVTVELHPGPARPPGLRREPRRRHAGRSGR